LLDDAVQSSAKEKRVVASVVKFVKKCLCLRHLLIVCPPAVGASGQVDLLPHKKRADLLQGRLLLKGEPGASLNRLERRGESERRPSAG